MGYDRVDLMGLGIMCINPMLFPIVMGMYIIRHSETAADIYVAAKLLLIDT